MDEPNKIVWTNGLYQDELDDANLEFRFAAYNKSNKLRVFKMNVETLEMNELNWKENPYLAPVCDLRFKKWKQESSTRPSE